MHIHDLRILPVYNGRRDSSPRCEYKCSRIEEQLTAAGRPRGYLPIDGLATYTNATRELVFGAESELVAAGRVATTQTIGGSGALRVGAELLAQSLPHADHVVFTANATEALNIALFGLFSAGDRIISTDCEHNSVLRPLYDLQTRGVSVDFVPADRQGNIRYED